MWLTVLLLVLFFISGILIFRNYGASSDEVNQIKAGHITWTAICDRFGRPAPDFGNLPKLKDYYNRYYGQAATFPTVLVEAIKGFSLDVSTILRLRHLWNFWMYFCGLVCFAFLIKLRFQRDDVVFLLLMIHILMPRIFGDVFYNDRDVLLISLFWITLLCFEWFRRTPGIPQTLIFAFFSALTINTRFFGLVLVFLPLSLFFSSDFAKKKKIWLVLGLTLIFWYAVTPVFWGNFFSELTAAIRTLATGRQRTQETNGSAEILFFGRYYRETDLPFFYLPLWIFISTPVIPQIICGIGIFRCFRKKTDLTDRFMLAFLILGISAVILIRPVLYNGWRHLYFFYVPILWFIGIGMDHLLCSPKKLIRTAAILFIVLSAGWSAFRIKVLHPYEYLYLNPLFSTRTSDFDRDYWRLSTSECLKWLAEKAAETITVGETNENLDNSIISLLPNMRARIGIQQYNALHRYPADYLIFNYSGEKGNEKIFPLYESVFYVEREGAKLAEIYKILRTSSPDILYSNHPETVDGDMTTEWQSGSGQDPEEVLLLEFREPTVLGGLSLLPGNDEQGYARSPKVSFSEDGETWIDLPLTVSGLFDLTFPPVEMQRLRICNSDPADVHWSVREIYFF